VVTGRIFKRGLKVGVCSERVILVAVEVEVRRSEEGEGKSDESLD
jgi:hypothetical protein